jgi:type IV pilus assembly protein PilC
VNGELKSATMEAASREEVVAQLRRQRLTVVKVDEQKAKGGGGSIKMRDIVIFTRQFSTMINSGLPLVQALDILAKQSENKALQEVIRQTVFDVESGHTVADALGRHPKAFNDLYVNMVAAGEAGGILDTILMRLATFMEKNDALVRKVKGAMIYPGVIMSVAGVAIAVLLIFVIPVFEAMFASVNLELPLPTQIVVMMSQFLIGYWWAVIAAVAARRAAQALLRTQSGKLVIDRLLLSVPMLGDVLRKSAVSRFTRTSARSSRRACRSSTGSRSRQDGGQPRDLRTRSWRRGPRSPAATRSPRRCQKSNVFPPMVISMIAVGEQTGGLDEMLTKIADFYDEEVDAAVSNLLSMLEPIMIVFLGVVVGGMVVAMYLPIFDMINTVQ